LTKRPLERKPSRKKTRFRPTATFFHAETSQRLFEAETLPTKRIRLCGFAKGRFFSSISNSIACFGAEISEIFVEACERSIRESIGRDFRISLIVFGAFRAAIETEADVDGSRRPARSPRSTVTPTSVGASKATPKALRTSREYRLRGPPRRV
jgi:hypothetical protein